MTSLRRPLPGGIAGMLALLAAVSLAAQALPDLESVPRVTVAALAKDLQRGAVVVVDVRDGASYAASHIPGALLVPIDEIPRHAARLKAIGKPIVTYCT